MQRIIPNLWCNQTADDAAEFYTRTFHDAKVLGSVSYPTEGLLDFQQPYAGKTLTIDLAIHGLQITLVNGGDEFRPGIACSFQVLIPDEQYLRDLHRELTEFELMPLQEYDFAPLYSWVADRYGVNWQLMLAPDADEVKVRPALMFRAEHQNQANRAVETYLGLFEDSEWLSKHMYPEANQTVTTDSILYSEFKLAGQEFVAMDSGAPQQETFTPGIAFLVLPWPGGD